MEDNELLEKYNTLWNKIRADVIKEFDSNLTYNKHILKTKIRCYGDEPTDFYDSEILKVESNHTCLAESAWILLSRNMKTIIPKNVNTLKKCDRYIIDGLESSSKDSDEEKTFFD